MSSLNIQFMTIDESGKIGSQAQTMGIGKIKTAMQSISKGQSGCVSALAVGGATPYVDPITELQGYDFGGAYKVYIKSVSLPIVGEVYNIKDGWSGPGKLIQASLLGAYQNVVARVQGKYNIKTDIGSLVNNPSSITGQLSGNIYSNIKNKVMGTVEAKKKSISDILKDSGKRINNITGEITTTAQNAFKSLENKATKANIDKDSLVGSPEELKKDTTDLQLFSSRCLQTGILSDQEISKQESEINSAVDIIKNLYKYEIAERNPDIDSRLYDFFDNNYTLIKDAHKYNYFNYLYNHIAEILGYDAYYIQANKAYRNHCNNINAIYQEYVNKLNQEASGDINTDIDNTDPDGLTPYDILIRDLDNYISINFEGSVKSKNNLREDLLRYLQENNTDKFNTVILENTYRIIKINSYLEEASRSALLSIIDITSIPEWYGEEESEEEKAEMDEWRTMQRPILLKIKMAAQNDAITLLDVNNSINISPNTANKESNNSLFTLLKNVLHNTDQYESSYAFISSDNITKQKIYNAFDDLSLDSLLSSVVLDSYDNTEEYNQETEDYNQSMIYDNPYRDMEPYETVTIGHLTFTPAPGIRYTLAKILDGINSNIYELDKSTGKIIDKSNNNLLGYLSEYEQGIIGTELENILNNEKDIDDEDLTLKIDNSTGISIQYDQYGNELSIQDKNPAPEVRVLGIEEINEERNAYNTLMNNISIEQNVASRAAVAAIQEASTGYKNRMTQWMKTYEIPKKAFEIGKIN